MCLRIKLIAGKICNDHGWSKITLLNEVDTSMSRIAKLTLISLASSLANFAIAAPADFEGLSAKIGINQFSLDFEHTGYIDNGTADPLLIVDKVDKGKTAGEIAISHTWSLIDKYLLTVGYETTFGTQDYGEIGYSYNGTRATGATDNLTVKVTDSSSFVVAPGMLISPDTALFFRLGQSKLKTETTDNDPTVVGVYRTTHSGILYGLGIEHNYNESFFMYGSYDFVDYGDETINLVPDPNPGSLVQKSSTSSLKLGIGYRF